MADVHFKQVVSRGCGMDIHKKVIGYTPDKSDVDANLFYFFRNQMTHSYRNLYQYSKELADTIQAFERLILLIVERYPYSIK